MKTLMKGNEAIAQAAIVAGCKAFFGYPITPQNEIPEYMAYKLKENGGCFVQAESEIAAINMVYGAAATGVRVMTSSSSPGIALKQEGITYLAGAKLPALIVSVSRSGPGLGGILPGQADYFQATRGGGNGDYNTPVYAPNSIQEATDLVQVAFNTAEKYRTPVMVLVDGTLAQMMEPVEIKEIERFKPELGWVANGETDKRAANVVNSLYLVGAELEKHNLRLDETYKQIKENEVRYESTVEEGTEIVFVAYGTPSRIALNAIDDLKEQGVKAAMIRPITLWPFPDKAFVNLPSSVKAVLVTELSMGQMVQDVRLAVKEKVPVHHYGRVGGMIFETEELVDCAKKILKG